MSDMNERIAVLEAEVKGLKEDQQEILAFRFQNESGISGRDIICGNHR